MFIQGNLQAVFEALFSVGAIDPVLKSDWHEIAREMEKKPEQYTMALKTINSCGGDITELIEKLSSLDRESINFIAVEVAREFAEFTDRKTLH